jgi:hypothetical protein
MRKNFLLRSLTLAFLVGLGASAPKISGAPCGTTVLWQGSTDGCTYPGVVNNVIDQNINVIGTVALVEGIHVEARLCDITVSVVTGDAIITGSGNRCDGVPSDPARLYLFAAFGRTINFNLQNSLIFSGTADGATQLDLLVTASGPGTISFTLADGQTVSFAPKDAGSGGTFFIEGMSDAAPGFVAFENSLVNTTGAQAAVIVGARSVITFASQIGDINPGGDLELQTKSTNGGDPRLRLELDNGGSFVIGSHPADLTLPDFMITDIDFTTQGNGAATFNARNISGTGAGLGAAVLIVNNNSLCPSNLLINPFCQGFTPPPFAGFVLTGPTGVLTINDQTYIEYVGTATNVCCTFTLLDECGVPEEFDRLRNGSAFIIDATDDDSPATINFLGSSALYFLSGVSNCGTISPDFTVNTSILNTCAGNIVLDVEGPLNVFGPALAGPDESGIQILSLQVAPTGCPVTVDSTLSDANFPARTFAKQPDGNYVQYNLAAFLINNRMSLFNTSLIHTDTIHKVYEHFNLGNPNLFSEPTYVGGDSYIFPCHSGRPRPTISFTNSKFRVHTNLASTGVDFLFPNTDVDLDNTSSLIFYNNGRCIDDGYGRNMILGTDVCFEDCITSTGLDSHLNVFQENAQTAGTAINLWIITSQNTDCITQGIPSADAILGQNAVQTIFLNNASNFSIGTNSDVGVDSSGATFPLTIPANVNLDGACLSFETRGGTLAYPPSSGTTGEGGIFVDSLGALRLLNRRIASFATMVTKSRGGIVDLPYNQVFFAPEIGITEWQPDMADSAQRILVPAGTRVSDFTLDWGAVRQTYCCFNLLPTPTSCFIPYEVEELPLPCACPAVTQNNLFNLPTIQGEVDQMQILRSRICDMVHLLVDGGFIRELVLINGFNTAEAPTGFIVVQNEGFVGIGSAHKDIDSLQASIVLGVNGVMLVANGNGNIELNEDIIINNVCHILSGTAFGQNLEAQVLQISSTTPKELRIKSTGVLDLTQFDTPFKILEITGQVKLVCEPGARIILNGGTLRFSGQSIWFTEPDLNTHRPVGTTVNSTDDIRVRLSGTGAIEMIQDASMLVNMDSYFGIETFLTCSNVTNIEWRIAEQASVQIGSNQMPGGVFQVGDTTPATILEPRSVSFKLELDGPGALFQLDRLGFFGMSSGIVDKPTEQFPNAWTIGCLSNLVTMSIIVTQGTLQANQIADGFDPIASLIAIGNQGLYTFNFSIANSVILGGSNMVKVNCVEEDLLSRISSDDLESIRNECNDDITMLNRKLIQLLVLDPSSSIQISNLGTQQINLPVITIDTDNLPGFLEEASGSMSILQAIIPTSLTPTVTNFAGISQNGFLQTGMFAGEFLLVDANKVAAFPPTGQPIDVSAQLLFNYLSTPDFNAQSAGRANFATDRLNQGTAGYIRNINVIRRDTIDNGFLLGLDGLSRVSNTNSLNVGAISGVINNLADNLQEATEIIGANVV